jgi:hypothetical protein
LDDFHQGFGYMGGRTTRVIGTEGVRDSQAGTEEESEFTTEAQRSAEERGEFGDKTRC